MKKGVLLLAYGGPDSLDDVRDYYIDVRGGRVPTDELVEELKDRYRAIGGKSPILPITNKKATALNKVLGDDYKVYVGMRHWHPFIQDTVAQMVNDGITEATSIVMAPHYSKMSVGKYHDKLNEAVSAQNNVIKFNKVEHWHTHPGYIQAVSEKVKLALNKFSENEREKTKVIFTAHSLPEKILEWNDPYPEQLLETSRLIAEKFDKLDWHFAYQSAGRTRDPWLGPDLLEKIDELHQNGSENILVATIGFIVDHLEVIYDIDIEGKEKAKEIGIHLERTESLNDDPQLISTLADLVKRFEVNA
jgi:protoporphyrin/coproporphyrin ferrochelatase